MKLIILIILSIFSGTINSMAQTSLTKDEIISSWSSFKSEPGSFKDAANIAFSPKHNKTINLFVDSLKEIGIEFFILYSESYPGYISIDPCIDDLYPTYSYLIWTSNNELNIKTIKDKCQTITITIDSLNIFSFYKNNKDSIQKEIIMPVILGAEQSSDKITYTMNSIDHEPNYSMYLVNGGTFKALNFTQNDVENSKSLFLEHNSSLRSIQLWKLIDRQIKSIQN